MGLKLFHNLCLLILLKSHSLHAQSYYGESPVDHDRCSGLVQIGYGDAYPIYNFPTEGKDGPWEIGSPYQSKYEYVAGRMDSKECRLEFVTYEDCVLQFRTYDYRRGELDCESQFLLNGDEKRHKRICGFAKVPRRFVSTGSNLYLVSYRQNGAQRTTPPTVSGVVRCVGRRHNYTEVKYKKTCEPVPTPPPPVVVCAPSEKNCTFLPSFAATQENDGASYRVTFSAGEAPTDELHHRVPCPDEVNGCSGWTNICYQTVDFGCNITANAVDSLTPGTGGVECISKAVNCRVPGSCTANGVYGPFVGSDTTIDDIKCPASANQICVWTVSQCIRPE